MGDWRENRLVGESAGKMTRGEAGTMAQTSGEEGAMRMQMRLQILVRVCRTLVSLHVGGYAGGWVDLRPSPMDSGKGTRLGKRLVSVPRERSGRGISESARSMHQEASRCLINALTQTLLLHPQHHRQLPKPTSSKKKLRSIVKWLKEEKSLKNNPILILKLTIWWPRASSRCSLGLSFPTRKWEVELEEHAKTSSSSNFCSLKETRTG